MERMYCTVFSGEYCIKTELVTVITTERKIEKLTYSNSATRLIRVNDLISEILSCFRQINDTN